MTINRLLLASTLALTVVAGTAWIVVTQKDAGSSAAKPTDDHPAEPGAGAHVEMPDAAVARANIGIATAGPATLRREIALYGRIGANEEQTAKVSPRFPGVLRSINKKLGDTVAKDEVLATVESNQSLTRYDIRAPIGGTVVDRDIALGEYATDQSRMFTIADLSTVWVDFSVYRQDFAKVRAGQPVKIDLGGGLGIVESTIAYVSPLGAPDTQSMLARAVVGNDAGSLKPGIFVSGAVNLDPAPVAVAVQSDAIQTLEGKPVVFVREGDRFETRPVQLGRADGAATEILSGLKPGDRYAARNSFVVKAELGKSGVAEE